MANPKSCLFIEKTVTMNYLPLPDCDPGQRNYCWHGKERGIADVMTKENTSTPLFYVLVLTEKQAGKIFIELRGRFGEQLKQFFPDDAVVQIILEKKGECLNTGWLPLEKNLVTLKKEILHDFVRESPRLSSKLMVKVTLTVAARQYNPTFQPENPFQINRKILQEAIGSNFVIVSSSGTEINCHKSFLCAHSDVLRAMIESSLTEALTNRVEMVDMSDDAVKAFLAFLYYWDITEACKDCEIAFELLHAAHKYNVTSLENAMRDLFLNKEASWFSVDGAVRLFAFCRNLDNGQELKMKGVTVLEAIAQNLEETEYLKELFKNDAEAGIDLLGCFFVA